MDPAGGEDGLGEERSLWFSTARTRAQQGIEQSHKEQTGLLQMQKRGKDNGDQMCKVMKHR